MQYLLTTCLVALLSHASFSQSILLGYNSTASGRNLTVQYEIARKSHEFSMGLGYNINRYAHPDDQSNFYKKRLYATEPYHHVNLNLTYQRYILTKKVKGIRPFLFYDLQAKYSTTMSRFVLPFRYDPSLVVNKPEEGILYRETVNYFGPFTWIENNIGIGFTADLTDKIYIKQRFGVGTHFILGYDDRIGHKLFSWFYWEFATLMHFSVGYRF